MTRTSQALKRLGVAGLVAVTVGAGLPALIASSAQAAATGIAIAPTSGTSGAQGTCVPLTVTLTGVTATDTSTVTITLTDPSATATATTSPQSAVFCQTDKNGLLQAPTAASNATTPASPGASQAGTGPTRSETFVTSPGQTTFQAGVYDTDLETVALQAFVNRDGQGAYDPNADPSATTQVTFTAGSPGQTSSTTNPGVFDQAANDNARKLTATQSATQAQSGVAGTNGSQVYTVTATNAAGDALRGVRVSYLIEAGGANSATTPPTGNCVGVTDNTGQVDCSVPTPKAGTDKITFYVNQTNGGAGSTSGTSGPDANEPKITVTASTSPSTADARTVSVTPTGQTFAPNTTVAYFATVTDANGTPVQGVDVTFTLTGVGSFQTSTGTTTAAQTVRTGADGKARVVTTAASNESGSQSVRADIASTTTSNTTGANQCANAAGTPAGTTTAGTCRATATNTIGTATASPSPSATPTATASPSPSPSATGTPTQATTLTLTSPATITPGVDSTMVGTGQPNADVELRCYSRTPENASQNPPPFFTARATNLGAEGRATFTLNPGTNTRCFLKYKGVADTHDAEVHSVVQNVATSLSLSAFRDGVRQYHFQGRILPTRAGQSVRLYRVATGAECSARRVASPCEILTATTSTFLTTDSAGKTIAIWRINRTFTGSGQFSFVARTPQTLTNVAGKSNTRLTVIH
jgi:hypothetical protein